MTSPSPELPHDLPRCHVVIGQLHAQWQHASERVESVSIELRDATARIAHLEALLTEHKKTIATQEETIEHLAADNTLLKRSLFGSRRERYTHDPSQALLFPTAPQEPADDHREPAAAPPKPKRTSKGRQPRVFPDFLPREEQRHALSEDEIPEAMRNHPHARRFFKKVGEQLELIPMQLKVVEQYQEVIVLDQANETTKVISAKRPASLIQSFAGNSVLAYLTVGRFADHLPYYRLEDVFGRSGFRIDRSTQWRWMRGLAQGVTPLVDLMWQRALQSQTLAMDETPVMELGGAGKTLKGYLWAGVGDDQHPYDCFFYTSDRRSIPAGNVPGRI